MPILAVTSDAGRALLVLGCCAMLVTVAAFAIAQRSHHAQGARLGSILAMTSGIIGGLAVLSALVAG